LQRRSTPVFLSQTGYVITLPGLVLEMTLFNGRYGALVWAGVALVFAGVFLATRQPAVER
jgi:drug/metabolite transporter (DMT)-like permease